MFISESTRGLHFGAERVDDNEKSCHNISQRAKTQHTHSTNLKVAAGSLARTFPFPRVVGWRARRGKDRGKQITHRIDHDLDHLLILPDPIAPVD